MIRLLAVCIIPIVAQSQSIQGCGKDDLERVIDAFKAGLDTLGSGSPSNPCDQVDEFFRRCRNDSRISQYLAKASPIFICESARQFLGAGGEGGGSRGSRRRRRGTRKRIGGGFGGGGDFGGGGNSGGLGCIGSPIIVGATLLIVIALFGGWHAGP